AAFPVLNHLPDGRLSVGILCNTYRDHYGFGEWRVLVSEDGGETWQPTDDPSVPQTWPGSSPRERYDRFARIQPDGTYVAGGAVGPRDWSAERRAEAEQEGATFREHPSGDLTRIVASSNILFVQRSRDGGQSWTRQEWRLPGLTNLTTFPRWTVLTDGTILLPAYADAAHVDGSHVLILRSVDSGLTWWPVPVPGNIGDEAAVVEVSPGRVLAHIRHGRMQPLLESWSDDGGRSWSRLVETQIWGFPPHLVRLRDGRILCSYGHRRDPLGVQAVFSGDAGRSWDVANKIVLRDDAGRWGLRYPQSPGLPGGRL